MQLHGSRAAARRLCVALVLGVGLALSVLALLALPPLPVAQAAPLRPAPGNGSQAGGAGGQRARSPVPLPGGEAQLLTATVAADDSQVSGRHALTATVAAGAGQLGGVQSFTATVASDDGQVLTAQPLPSGRAPSLPQSGGVKYSNVVTQLLDLNQGPVSTIVSNTITKMVMDNITLTEAVDGLRVLAFTFGIGNGNGVTVTVRPRIRFWYNDRASGGPGTYFLNASGVPVGYTLSPIAAPPAYSLYTVLLPPGFTFPAGRKTFWAGIAFDDDNGTTGASAGEMNNIGQPLYNPPTVGSSTDVLWQAGPGDYYGVNNPPGNLFNLNGSPVANIGWRFVFDNICSTAVTTTTDSGPGSLRSALACATPGDTVSFSALAPNSTIVLTSGELTVTKPITIDGSTATNLSVSGDGAFRVFSVMAPATFIGFTIRDGNEPGPGGGLYSGSPLTLIGMQLVANSGQRGGGAFVNTDANVAQTTFMSNTANGSQEIVGEGFESGAPGWSAGTSGAGTNWVITTTAHTGSLSAFAGDPGAIGDSSLYSPIVTPSTPGGVLRFWLNYNTEFGFDGVALEIKIGGAAYTDVISAGGSFLSNGYNGTIFAGTGNPLAGRPAWTGNNGGFALVQVSLPVSATNQPLSFRWRMDSDSSQAGTGVWLDDVSLRVPTTSANGGGLLVVGRLDLTGTQFLSNTSGASGGGLLASGVTTLTNAVFVSNTATFGGGGASSLFKLSVRGGRFERNTATHSSTSLGGGLNTSGGLDLAYTLFVSNTSIGSGGGLYAGGTAVLTGANFISNTATFGGGLYAGSTAVLTGANFISNTAKFSGGGMYAQSALTVTGGMFEHNAAPDAGGGRAGGLYANGALNLMGTRFLDNFAGLIAGALIHTNGDARIVNALFARNSATSDGPELFLGSSGSVQVLHTTITSPTLASGAGIAIASSTVAITDTIVASHSIGIDNVGGSVSEDYNLLFGNVTPRSGVAAGPHDQGGDPKFRAPAADDYHLTPGSAAIDTGINAGVTSDFEGDYRPLGAGFDIGFDESPGLLFLPLIRR